MSVEKQGGKFLTYKAIIFLILFPYFSFKFLWKEAYQFISKKE